MLKESLRIALTVVPWPEDVKLELHTMVNRPGIFCHHQYYVSITSAKQLKFTFYRYAWTDILVVKVSRRRILEIMTVVSRGIFDMDVRWRFTIFGRFISAEISKGHQLSTVYDFCRTFCTHEDLVIAARNFKSRRQMRMRILRQFVPKDLVPLVRLFIN